MSGEEVQLQDLQLFNALIDLDIESYLFIDAPLNEEATHLSFGESKTSALQNQEAEPADISEDEFLGASCLTLLSQLSDSETYEDQPSITNRNGPKCLEIPRRRQLSEDSCASVLSFASWRRRSCRLSTDSALSEASLATWRDDFDAMAAQYCSVAELDQGFSGFNVPQDEMLLDRCSSGPDIFSIPRPVENHHLPGVGELRFLEDPQKSSWARHMIQCCQNEECMADLSDAKPYNKRKRLCASCMASSSIVVDRIERRFCQQCGVLHPLSKFSGYRRVCRMPTRRSSSNLRERWNRRKAAAEPTIERL